MFVGSKYGFYLFTSNKLKERLEVNYYHQRKLNKVLFFFQVLSV